jgi:hypothetical protein
LEQDLHEKYTIILQEDKYSNKARREWICSNSPWKRKDIKAS